MEEIAHNPELQKKINSACRTIEVVLAKYKRPCILSSFGKDSVVLLHMIRSWFTNDLDVVYFRHPWFQRKYDFSDKLAKEWDLTLHSEFPPLAMSIYSSEEKGAEIVNHYGLGQKTMMLLVGKQATERQVKWLCGRDMLARPCGNTQWNWDVAFSGHKSSDVDAAAGAIPLLVDIHQQANACDAAYPLRHFTDADIWEYIEKWDLPYNRLRYKKNEDGTYSDDTDSIFNPDYQPYCSKCLDRRADAAVICPKNNLEVTNLSGSLNHVDFKNLNYLGAK